MKKGVALAVGVAIAVGIGLFSRRAPEPAPPAPVPPPAAAKAAPAAAPDAPLPPAAESDARVRSLFEKLSPSPALQQWLAAPDLLERGAAAIDNFAEDVSPRKPLDFLAPRSQYVPGRFERYDAFAGVIGSIDASALASALRTLHPLLESAYHKLGYPGKSVDAAIARALQRIADAPAASVDTQVRRRGQVFVYVDPKLEALGPIEKHLLRLGRVNERRVQDKARELAAALKQ